jgi:hypothetical protein
MRRPNFATGFTLIYRRPIHTHFVVRKPRRISRASTNIGYQILEQGAIISQTFFRAFQRIGGRWSRLLRRPGSVLPEQVVSLELRKLLCSNKRIGGGSGTPSASRESPGNLRISARSQNEELPQLLPSSKPQTRHWPLILCPLSLS